MDLDQMSRRIVQDVLEIVDPDYYEFEGESQFVVHDDVILYTLIASV